MGLAMHLEGGVVGQHRVVGRLRRHQVRVHRTCCRIASGWDDGVETPPDADQMSLPQVVGHQRLAGSLVPGILPVEPGLKLR